MNDIGFKIGSGIRKVRYKATRGGIGSRSGGLLFATNNYRAKDWKKAYRPSALSGLRQDYRRSIKRWERKSSALVSQFEVESSSCGSNQKVQN
ncbi:MAG: hypothetical protein V3U49_02995 [Nitrososphaerales archaeon]